MGKAATARKNRWNTANYDRLICFMPKGHKAVIQEFAKNQGESTNGFINTAISDRMEKIKEHDEMKSCLRKE